MATNFPRFFAGAISEINIGATTEEAPAEEAPAEEEVAAAEEQSFHYVIKQKFIEGGWEWMSPVLICLIIGLAIVVERTIFLNLASTNTTKPNNPPTKPDMREMPNASPALPCLAIW